MTLFDNKIIPITGNADPPEHFMWLESGLHKIDITYGTGAAGTISLLQGMSMQEDLDEVDSNGDPYSTTVTDSVVVHGPGYLGVASSGVSGTITVRGTRC